MRATFAFDVCHDVYRAAREVIDTKIPTMNLESSGKYLWRPDRMPHLAEYVADFARAGERALLGGRQDQKRGRGSSRNVLKDGGLQNVFSVHSSQNALRVKASRMTMFRVFYLGGAEYSAARRHLGISELNWADWADEIRTSVGRELTRAGVFPPSNYFLRMTKASEGSCEKERDDGSRLARSA